MFTNHIDLGQVLISGLISLIGYFVKHTIDKFEVRIDNHDKVLFNMYGDIKQIKGILGTRKTDSE